MISVSHFQLYGAHVWFTIRPVCGQCRLLTVRPEVWRSGTVKPRIEAGSRINAGSQIQAGGQSKLY